MAHVPDTGAIKLGGHIAKEYSESWSHQFHLGSFHSKVFQNFWTYSGSLQGSTNPVKMSDLKGCGFAYGDLGGTALTTKHTGSTSLGLRLELPEFHFTPNSFHFFEIHGTWGSKGTDQNHPPWTRGLLNVVSLNGKFLIEADSLFASMHIGKVYSHTPIKYSGETPLTYFEILFSVTGKEVLATVVPNRNNYININGEIDSVASPRTKINICNVVNVYANAGNVHFGVGTKPQFYSTAKGLGYDQQYLNGAADNDFVRPPQPSHMASAISGLGPAFSPVRSRDATGRWEVAPPAKPYWQQARFTLASDAERGGRAGPDNFSSLGVGPKATGANHHMWFKAPSTLDSSQDYSVTFWSGNFD